MKYLSILLCENELFVVYGIYALKQLKNIQPVTIISARQVLDNVLGIMII